MPKKKFNKKQYIEKIIELQHSPALLDYLVVETNFPGISYIDPFESKIFINININPHINHWLRTRHYLQIINNPSLTDIEYFDPSSPNEWDIKTHDFLLNTDFPSEKILQHPVFSAISNSIVNSKELKNTITNPLPLAM